MRGVILAIAFVTAGCTGAAPTNPGDSTPVPTSSATAAPTGSQVAPTASASSSAASNSLAIGRPGGGGAATAPDGESVCSQQVIAHAVANLSWMPAIEPGDEQVIQVTIFSFDLPGSVFSEPLEPSVDQFVLEQLSGQATHSWRVLTRHENTWTPSEPAEFVGATCVADGL